MRITMLLAEHRVATLIVATALAATAGFFMFALPKGPRYQNGDVLVLRAPAPDHRWTWSQGTPGFVFGEYDDRWNVSGLRPANLDALRAIAPRFGVTAQSLRILEGMRTAFGNRPQLLVAGSDARGRTCIGIQLENGPVRFVCHGRTPGIVV